MIVFRFSVGSLDYVRIVYRVLIGVLVNLVLGGFVGFF